MTLETFRQSYDCPRGLEIRQFETHLEAAHLTDHDTAEKVLASLLLIKEVIKEWKKGVEDRGGTLKKQPYYLAISRLRESVKAVLDQPQWKTIRKFFEKMESGGADPFQVVHYYNQGFEPRIINNDDTVNQGWCFGMVLQWIAKKKAGSGDFWTWFETPEGESAVYNIMAKQSLMEAGLNKKLANMVVRREDYTRLEDNILGRHNLNCKAGPAECSAAEIGEKFSGIAPDTQTFFTLDMHQEEGAHVIGLVGSRDGGWCLMDPNRGEFQIDCQNLADAQERVDALTMFVYTFLSTFKFTKFFFRAFR